MTPLTCRVSGGLFQDFAPSAYHMEHVLLPTLRKTGVAADLRILRPGYIPGGGGIIEVKVRSLEDRLAALRLSEQGGVDRVDGIALSLHLQERNVSGRTATECQRVLATAGYNASIRKIYDTTALQAGAALALFAHTDSGCIIGSDGARAPRRSSEQLGRSVARNLIEDLASGATLDRFLADQVIIFAALARRTSSYRIPKLTEHVDTNLWLIERLLGAKAKVSEDLVVEIEGVGYERNRRLRT